MSFEPAAPGSKWTPPPQYRWVTWWAWGSTAVGQQCFYRAGGWFHEDVADDRAEALGIDDAALVALVKGGTVGRCRSVADIKRGGDPPPIVDGQVLFDAITALLPRPDIVVAPGKAITGLPAWLETNRPLTFVVPDAGLATLPGGLVDVTAEATFTVDWGDGTRDGPFSRPGIPYDPADEDHPAGIRHNWIDVGTRTVTVTDTWTVTFEDRLGRSDTVTGDLVTTEELEVIELQAVLTD